MTRDRDVQRTFTTSATMSVNVRHTIAIGIAMLALPLIASAQVVLTSGVPKTGLSGALQSSTMYTITVPSGSSALQVTTAGGSGDVDVYVRAGSPPTLSVYNCRGNSGGNGESCSITNPTSTTWYVMLYGYAAYSGVTLTATVTAALPVAAITSFAPSATTVALGQSVDITISGKNTGAAPTNTTGYLSIGFRQLTGTGDASQIATKTATNSGSTNKYAKGYNPLYTVSGATMTAQYLVAEFARTNWLANEVNTYAVTWTPTAPGTYVVEGGMALQTNGANGFSRAPTSGSTNQQGAYVQQVTITVTGPAVAQLTSFGASVTTATVGQAIDLTLVGRNTGGVANTTGYMSIGFRQLTGTGDGSQVVTKTTTNGGSASEYPKGYSPLYTVSGGTMTAQYLIAEFARTNWPANEQNSFAVTWTPTTAGTYVIEGGVALQTNGASTYSRAPTSGPTNQQGANVQQITITVTAAPSAQLVSFTPSSNTGIVGQPMDLTLVGRNIGNGPTNTTGYLSIGFRQLTGAGDASQVVPKTATNGGATNNYPKGFSPLYTVTGATMTAQYLVSEFARTNWAVNEQNTYAVTWTPTAPGTYVIEGGVALQTNGASGYSRAPTSGPTNQQGANVQQITIVVTNPLPPVASIVSLVASTSTITVGQSIDFTLVGANTGTGPSNTKGYMSLAFRELTGSGDASQTSLLSATGGGTYAEYPRGFSPIYSDAGSPLTAQYLLTEYDKDNWAPGEQNTYRVRFTPTVPGTYTIDGKLALQVAGATYSRAPTTGPVDQQSSMVRRITVTVLSPARIASAEVRAEVFLRPDVLVGAISNGASLNINQVYSASNLPPSAVKLWTSISNPASTSIATKLTVSMLGRLSRRSISSQWQGTLPANGLTVPLSIVGGWATGAAYPADVLRIGTVDDFDATLELWDVATNTRLETWTALIKLRDDCPTGAEPYELKRRSGTTGTAGAIILVHGYDPAAIDAVDRGGACSATATKDYGSQYFDLTTAGSDWNTLQLSLEQRGFEVWTYRWPSQHSMEAAATNLTSAVRNQTALAGKRLFFVGHSMGGLVAGRAASGLTSTHTVQRVVTLGTPHDGTGAGVLASLTQSEAGVETVAGSSFLAAVNTAMQTSGIAGRLRAIAGVDKGNANFAQSDGDGVVSASSALGRANFSTPQWVAPPGGGDPNDWRTFVFLHACHSDLNLQTGIANFNCALLDNARPTTRLSIRSAIFAQIVEPPTATLVSFTASATTLSVGQSIDLTLVGRNTGTGPTNTTGYLSMGFPQLTGTGDGSQVATKTATNGGSTNKYAKGFSPIYTVNGATMTAQYFLTEYSRVNWAANEQNTFAVTWTPTTPGTYVIEGGMALQTDGANGYSRAPLGGSVNQQGAIVQQLTVTVLAPPVAQIVSFATSATTVRVGQPVDVTFVGKNTGAGPANASGYLSLGFRQLTGTGDASQIVVKTATNGGVTASYPSGHSPLYTVSGTSMTAQYLLAEYTRQNWPASEQNTFAVTWTPTAPGNYLIEGGLALQTDGANAYSRAPITGPTNQQGAHVQPLVVTVIAPPSIALTPSSVSFSGAPGGSNPPSQSVQISDASGGTLTGVALGGITYASGPTGWLNASLNGTTISLTATIGQLTAGTYNAIVPVTATGASASNLPVTLVVSTNPTVIVLTPQTLTFAAQVRSPAPSSQGVQIVDARGASLSGLSLGASVYGSGQPTGWLSATLNGSTATISVAHGNLVAGVYAATIPVTATGAPDATINVNLTVVSGSIAGESIVIAVGATATSNAPVNAKLVLPLILDLSQAPSRNVASLTGSITFDAQLLAFDSVKAGFGSLTANTSGAAAGTIALSVFDAAGTTASQTTLATLYFTTKAAGASTVSVAPSVLSDAQGANLLSLVRTRGNQVCAGGGLWGDVNADGAVNIVDAQQIARYSVALPVQKAVELLAYGDVSADGQVNIIDAQQIARYSVGLAPWAPRINTPSAGSCATAPSGFTDDFASGLGNWTVVDGSWTATAGALTGEYDISFGSPSDPQGDLLLIDSHQPASANWRAEIQLSSIRWNYSSGYDLTYANAAFTLWAGPSEKLAVSGGFAINNAAMPTTLTTVDIGWQSYSPWASGGFANVAVPAWTPSLWNTLALEKRGDTYTVSFNGQVVYTFTRAFSVAPKIGLHVYGRTLLDNFRIIEF